ncbi:dTDP-4-amino-4,6-dideoxygalactose transaminase [Arthrobacter pascens]|uniref:DegT/DnrJ/EryC1/StrS family aminotransferase n=1 Tax=Arthrobacter pascens TaxID=1677 RepID=UPI00278A11A9|nr:DegT/DnrJ/EryC1/StrS family aminotransferase [Arthrobacter pascens]MDQ0636126.1 dTDP-4-amino-4,6-dideoxygalactose transaminase [Arthrobacter pascens]
MNIPLVDLAAQSQEVEEELLPEIQELFRSGQFIGGKAVELFEQVYAEFLGSRYCIGVGNGTDALEMALRAVGVTRNSEVIIPVNTFIATAEAVIRIGAIPIFVDVDEKYLLISAPNVAAAVTSRTSAIVPVHLYGQVAAVEELESMARDAGAHIVEDAAQAQGATRFGRSAGSLGSASATSFYPGKNLGAAGDAGAVITDNESIARTVRMLSSHGSIVKYVHETVGFNSRLDAIQATVLSIKLRRLNDWNARRRQVAARYDQMLREIDDIILPKSMPGNMDVWHLYVIRIPQRDAVLKRLHEAGIGAGIHYPQPLHRTPALIDIPARAYPVAERAADQILSLPIHAHLTETEQQFVVDTLLRALRGRGL